MEGGSCTRSLRREVHRSTQTESLSAPAPEIRVSFVYDDSGQRVRFSTTSPDVSTHTSSALVAAHSVPESASSPAAHRRRRHRPDSARPA